MVVRKGRAHGIFLDNTYRSTFDVGRESQGLLSFGAEGGELDYYFIDGPRPKQVIERYTQLTGRMPLPPLLVARLSPVPLQLLSGLQGARDRRRLPPAHASPPTRSGSTSTTGRLPPLHLGSRALSGSEKLVADLRAQGFRLVTIVDPHPKERWATPLRHGPGRRPLREARGRDASTRRPVWPSQAEKDPGPSVFPGLQPSGHPRIGGARSTGRCSTSAWPASGTT